MVFSHAERRARLIAATACSALVALPFLVVDFPPVTDLPQHVAQIRLFVEALSDPDGPYRIQWFTPYSLSYLLIGAAWAASSPRVAGRIALLLLAVATVLGVHWLAYRRRRPLAAAILVCPLFFSHVLYWGFLSFAVGWLTFMVWFVIVVSRPRDSYSFRDALLLLLGAWLLYFAHALWFAAGVAWLVLHCFAARLSVRASLLRSASVSPACLVAALWYPKLESLGFVSPTVWFVTPTGRLSFSWLVDGVLGGLQGPGELLVVAVLAAWVLAADWRRPAEPVDRELLALAAMLATLAFFLPDQHMNTIGFAVRWLPPAAIVLILALPAPRFALGAQPGLALALLAVFSVSTAAAWKRFERDELSGLRCALDALPERPRVLGLDFVKDSTIVKGRPFLQTFAYSQVLRGGGLNFSFANFAPSPVVYRNGAKKPWTIGLEWFAEQVRPADFYPFDYALVNGSEQIHAEVRSKMPVEAATDSGRWRLYRVNGGNQ
jgi:hypothetical protein